MSILLESLSQQQSDKGPSSQLSHVPSIHETHYDDEMLGDEWLLARIKKWKLLTVLMLVLLIVSWSYFYFSLNFKLTALETAISTSEPSSPELAKNSSIVKNPAATSSNLSIQTESVEQSTSQPVEESDKELAVIEQQKKSAIPHGLSDKTIEDTQQPTKTVYQPKKRSASEAQSKTNSTDATSITSSRSPTKETTNKGKSNAPITREELPQDLQDKFPSLVVDSYVVADSKDESFIILDGGFYKISQVIAPNLVLRDIAQDQIVVEFHQYWIKIPLK